MQKSVLAFLLLISLPCFPQAILKTMKRFPDTGQTQSYTTTFGEDNDYSINFPAYTDNGDGTITDTITGLMWQKSDGGERTFEAAKFYADTLHLAGYSDWRLPLPQEMVSIFNHQKNNPAMDVSYFPSTGAEYWWTSVKQTGDTTKVWCGNAGGGIGNHLKSETISAGGTKKFHVKAVRIPQMPGIIANRFSDNGDGSITDNLTKLMWQKNPAATGLTWEQALTTAEGLSLAGFDDWRLPNIKELYSIHDATRTNPAADPLFGLQPAAKYWSSTSIPGQQGVKAWFFDTRFGIISYELKTAVFPVMAVRGPVDITTEIHQQPKNIAFNAQPNPGNQWVFSGLQPGELIRITDSRGQEVFWGSPANHSFSFLPSGLYLARSENGRMLKLIKN